MKKIDEISKKLKRDSLKEDYRPSEGIWYWVWLRPKWKLTEFKKTEYGDMTHEDAWTRYVSGKIAKHYGVSNDDLKDAYTGMPRGRVVRIGKKDVLWVFYHGDDTPISFGRAKFQLVSRFELRKQASEGQTGFQFHEHETMQEDDMAIVQRSIGKVPY